MWWLNTALMAFPARTLHWAGTNPDECLPSGGGGAGSSSKTQRIKNLEPVWPSQAASANVSPLVVQVIYRVAPQPVFRKAAAHPDSLVFITLTNVWLSFKRLFSIKTPIVCVALRDERERDQDVVQAKT